MVSLSTLAIWLLLCTKTISYTTLPPWKRGQRVCADGLSRQPSVQKAKNDDESDHNDTTLLDEQRRSLLLRSSSSTLSTFGLLLKSTNAATADGDIIDNAQQTMVRLPLEWVPRLNAYLVYFTLFDDAETERFGAVIDTGSPFLTVPAPTAYCKRQSKQSLWGCYRPELTRDSGYSNTIERFNNNEGIVVWRKAPFGFEGIPSAQRQMVVGGKEDLVFGVLDERLMDGPGGVFLGLIQKTDKWIRPSFLGQLDVQAFQIDLRVNNSSSLVLSTQSMIDDQKQDYIPLVSDLNRRFGFPVVHYTAVADGIHVNGKPLQVSSSSSKPIYVILDTGVTGMVVSQELFDERYAMARQNREKSLWGSVEVTFRTQKGGQLISLQATKPVTTPLGPLPGRNAKKANVVVIGLAFLEGHEITVDIQEERLRIA